MKKEEFIKKLYQLHEKMNEVIAFRKSNQPSGYFRSLIKDREYFSVSSVFQIPDNTRSYNVYRAYISNHIQNWANILGIAYTSDSQNAHTLYRDFEDRAIQPERLMLSEDSADRLSTMLDFTGSLNGIEQPLDAELAMNAFDILNKEKNVLGINYQFPKGELIVTPADAIERMQVQDLLGIMSSDIYLNPQKDTLLLNRIIHSVKDVESSYFITRVATLEREWTDNLNRKHKGEEIKSIHVDLYDENQKDRHGLDGQQDRIVRLNLFTNETIIGWKVPTNLSASTALGLPYQYSNYSTNNEGYHAFSLENEKFYARLPRLYETTKIFEKIFAERTWEIITDEEKFGIYSVNVRRDQFGHLIGMKYAEKNNDYPQLELYYDLLNEKLDFNRLFLKDDGSVIQKMSVLRDFMDGLDESSIFITDLEDFKKRVNISKALYLPKKQVLEGFRMLSDNSLVWITNMGIKSKLIQKEIKNFNQKNVLGMLTHKNGEDIHVIMFNSEIPNASEKLSRAMNYIETSEWRLRDRQQVISLMEDLLKQKVNETQTVQDLIIQHQIELNLTDIHGDDPPGLVTEFLRSARESRVTRNELTHVDELVQWSIDYKEKQSNERLQKMIGKLKEGSDLQMETKKNNELNNDVHKQTLYSLEPAVTLENEPQLQVDAGIQALVDTQQLYPWKKNPNIYFVKGLKKVAIERQEDGSFKVSEKFQPTTETEKKKVEELLAKQTGIMQAKEVDPLAPENISQHALELIKNYTRNPQDTQEYLAFMSKFPELSPRNVALIQQQWHGANAVATYKQWDAYHDKLGLTADDIEPSTRVYRNRKTGEEKTYTDARLSVRTGEKAQITLFRPVIIEYIPALDEKGKQTYNSKGQPLMKEKRFATDVEKQALKEDKIAVINKRTTFTTYKVFELSQTNLKPESYPKAMPNKPVNYEADPTKVDAVIQGLKEYAQTIGVPIHEDTTDFLGNAKGGFIPELNRILLNRHNTPTENITVTIHELAHATLHHKNAEKIPTPIEELEAEMTSYIVSKRFGIDTTESSVGYIANWTKNLKELDDQQLSKSLDRIHKSSKKMIETIQNAIDKGIKPVKDIANPITQPLSQPIHPLFGGNTGRSI